MSEVEFLGFVDNTYPNVPYAGKRKSNYIDLPNSHYDPIEGQRVMETQLELLASLERYGLDGAVFSEQHNGPIGLLGNPMLAGAWLAARTERIKIVVNGPLLNAYQNPVRLAEEIAMVDTMSKGRLMVGFPMGHGMQHHSTGINPATARERHREAHDLLVKALRDPGPFEWQGKYFNIPYVNLWPRPMHDLEFIMPGGGSLETLKLAAERRYTYQNALAPWPSMVKTLERFRELCREAGYEPDPRQSAAVISVHVAETDKTARREVEALELWNYQNYFRSVSHDNFPPGYVSVASLRAARSGGYRSTPITEMTYDDLLENRWLISGSPETVTARLSEAVEELGAGRIIMSVSNGIKPRWMVDKSLGLFAEQVLPHFRPSGKPLSAGTELPGYTTNLEYAVKRRKDAPAPTAARDGYLIDVTKADLDGVDARVEPWPPAQTG
ncbi:LLM class flavin-dependent oxidoreductase [Streptomyces sp. NPDC006872]|uniref:LLM class flavin-dependent oxidoreductase n=1 Tax=Streptomyces sp. NPDC006872 TaxID=3155720 RepID=UPI0033CD5FFD